MVITCRKSWQTEVGAARMTLRSLTQKRCCHHLQAMMKGGGVGLLGVRGSLRCRFPTLSCSRRSEDSHRSFKNAPTAAVYSPMDTPHRQVAAGQCLLPDHGRGTQSSKHVGLCWQKTRAAQARTRFFKWRLHSIGESVGKLSDRRREKG